MKYSKQHYCRNCHYPLAYKAKFCSHCGQKDTDGKVQVGDLIQQLFFRVFRLESKYFLILWHLLIPGKVSLAYFQGKQKRYPPPVQFFFVVMFFFLLALGTVFSPNNLMVNSKEGGIVFGEPNDSLTTRESLASSVRRMHNEERRYLLMHELKTRYDSFPAEMRSPDARRAIDSLFNWAAGAPGSYSDTFSIDVMDHKYRIASIDMYQSDVETIIKKYKVENWINRILLRQEIKIITDPTRMIGAWIGNLTWTFFTLVAVLAGVLRLLYWRQKRFYVEHFVFLLHQHTANFLLLALALTLHHFDLLNWAGWLLVLAWLAMFRFYGQSGLKTFVKWTIFSLLYLICFLVLFVLGVLVVFLIF